MPDKAPLMMTIAILGGTGKEGSGLAMRWALSGYPVIIGSRDAEKAVARVTELNESLSGDYLIGMDNVSAAQKATIIVLSVPYSAHRSTLESVWQEVQGKILVDITVPAIPPKVYIAYVPEGISAGLEAQSLLGEGVRVVSAFQNISASKLSDLHGAVDCDVLVCGDDIAAKADVIKLAEAAGMRGIDAGMLANSVAVEALTSVLVHINRTYKVKGAGIRITGLA